MRKEESIEEGERVWRQRGRRLLRLARHSLEHYLGVATPIDEPVAAWLHEPGAVFITLRRRGNLRGCVGSVEAHRPLIQDLRANTVAAATRDPRFPPLTVGELVEVTLEVSLLTPPQPLKFDSEAEALAQFRPGLDGVVLSWGAHRATFLPQVWEQLAEPAAFLAQLKRKARLPPDFWDPDLKLDRYRVRKWCEPPATAAGRRV